MIVVTADHGGHDKDHGSFMAIDRTIPLILSGDGLKKGKIPGDCDNKVSHLDVFPTVFEYLRLDVDEKWELDGKSRINFSLPPATSTDHCNLARAKPVIALSGAYIFNSMDTDNMNKTASLSASDLNVD